MTLELTINSIAKESLSATNASVCDGSGTTITTNSSETGVNYTLKDAANGNTIDGPSAGTGSSLSFNTGNLSAATDFYIEGETSQTLSNTAGTALDFDGVNDYIELPSTLPVANTSGNPWTIEFWALGSTVGNQYIYSEGNSSNQNNVFAINTAASGQLNIFFRNSTGSNQITSNGLTTNSVLDGSNWHHFAVAFDGLGSFQAYVDGVADNGGTYTPSGTMISDVATIAALGRIGGIEGPINIDIDEFRIWNVERSASQIQSSMNSPLSGSEAGLVAYYTMEDGTGSTLTDQSSNNNDGTLKNMDNADWVTGFGASSGAICSTNSDTVSVSVNQLEDASFSYGVDTICDFSGTQMPTITGTTGGTFHDVTGYLSQFTTFNSSTGALDPTIWLDVNHVIMYTTNGACPDTAYDTVRVGQSNFTTENPVSACGSYTSTRGKTYTTSGTYTDTVVNADGCYDFYQYTLTINNPTSESFTASACGSYMWQGMTYTQSGTYYDTIPNSQGCDSLMTLNLTINNPTFSFPNYSIVACGEDSISAEAL
jgi:hypothetical protein